MSALETILAILSGWLAAAFGWIKWLHELREKRLERNAREKAEEELNAIRRRSTDKAPYFLPSNHRFDGLAAPSNKPGQQLWIPGGFRSLLCFMRDEVDRTTTAGELVYLVVENHGSNAYEIAIKLDGKTAALVALEPNDGYKLYAIQYSYSPERHGREESVEIRFLAANGVRDAHRYATTHGLRTLKRIDPP